MKEVQFNKIKYSVPESWEEVTLGMVMKVQENYDILPEADLMCVVSGYVGIPLEELKVSKLAQVNKIVKYMSFIYDEYKPELKPGFKFKGERYTMDVNVQNIRFEDYVSAQTILQNYKDNPVAGLPRLVAVLCKKPGESLDDIDLDQRAEEFKGLSWVDVKNVEFFFTQALRTYASVSQLSLTESQMVELIRAMLKELKTTMKLSKVPSGGTWFTKLRILFLRIYLWYLNRELERYFSTIPSSP